MTRRDVFRYLGVVALCPLGGYVVFVLYVLALTDDRNFVLPAVIWAVGYAIATLAAGVLGVPFLIAQSRRRYNAWALLPAFIAAGVAGGAIVYALSFGAETFMWETRLAFYALLGLGVALGAWVLASFGPLRLSGVSSDEPRGAT